MNPNYNQTITVYNCLRAGDNPDSTKDIWYRTVLTSCFYKNELVRVDLDKGSRMSNVYTARIPEHEDYRPYHEWCALSEDKRSKCFTFNLGDIVVLGECKGDITGKSPDTASEMLQHYKPDAFKVTAFSDNTSHIAGKHYRVGG